VKRLVKIREFPKSSGEIPYSIAALHSPLSIPGVGVIKYEDTYVIEKDRAKRITDYEYEIAK